MGIDPIILGFLGAGLTFLPAFMITCTSFLKISIVLNLIRNAIGVQQIPPNIATYGISLMMTVYIMAPIFSQMYHHAITAEPEPLKHFPSFVHAIQEGADPLRQFLIKNAELRQREFFYHAARRLWGVKAQQDLSMNDFVVLIPSFVVSELNDAFQVGFLLYLPFLIIDLVVSNLLLALGMMMVSPVMISLPLKLFLFIMVDGWTRLLHGLILSYS